MSGVDPPADPPASGDRDQSDDDDDENGSASEEQYAVGEANQNNSSAAAGSGGGGGGYLLLQGGQAGRRNWEESFQALVRFKNKFGNCLVPSAYEEDTALGHWVRKQRRNETAGQLSPERRDKLDKLGFVWKLRGDQYANAAPQKAILEQGMRAGGSGSGGGGGAEPPAGESALQAYRKLQDNNIYSKHHQQQNSRSRSRSPPTAADAPTSSPTTTTPAQRQQKTPSPTTTTGTTPSGGAGNNNATTTTAGGGGNSSSQSRQKRNWIQSFEALVIYYNKFGNCNVPRRYPPDLALGQWVSKQRFQKDKLTKRQYEKLQSIGFDFVLRKEKHQKIWEDKLGLLKSYKNKHGHCNVPSDYMIGDLGRWVADQRKAYAEDRLQSERIIALEEVGLALENYSNNNNDDGDNNDDSDYEENNGGGPSSGTPTTTTNNNKAARQQQQHVQPTRVKVTLAERWETQYEHLARFHRSEGHCVVPRYYDRTLSMWAQRQRVLNSQNKLKQDRKEMLDELNFEWYVGIKELPEHYFDEMIQRLVDFQHLEGHVDVPRTFLRGGLGEWIDQIKTQGRDGVIGPQEAERLLRVGFTWMENRESWYRNLEDIAYEVTNCRRRDDGLSLSLEMGNWLKVQYMLLDYDLLPPKREEKLESLGLDWDGENFSWREVGDVIQEGKVDNVMVFDDEISTGYDLKDAAISWTPDRKAARKAKSTINEGTPGPDKASPIVTIEADAVETQTTKDSDEVVVPDEETDNQDEEMQGQEAQAHQDADAAADGVAVIADEEKDKQDKDTEVEEAGESTQGSQVLEATTPDKEMQATPEETAEISQGNEAEGGEKPMPTNEKSKDTKDTADEPTTLESSKVGTRKEETTAKSSPPPSNPEETAESSQTDAGGVDSVEETTADKKRACPESPNQGAAEDEEQPREPDRKKGKVDNDCQEDKATS